MGAGGATDLVGHHADLGPLAVEPQHGAAKVLAHRAIHPAGAQHPGTGQLQRRHLAGGLAGAIHPERIEGLVGPVGGTLGAVEDKIRAHLQQPAPRGRQRFSKGRRGAAIDGMGQLRLAFGPIHRRIGAGIEHPGRPVLKHRCGAGLRIGQVQLGPAAGNQPYPLGPGVDQGLAQLAGGAGEQYLHRLYGYTRGAGG